MRISESERLAWLQVAGLRPGDTTAESRQGSRAGGTAQGGGTEPARTTPPRGESWYRAGIAREAEAYRNAETPRRRRKHLRRLQRLHGLLDAFLASQGEH